MPQLNAHTDQPPKSKSLEKTCRIPGFLSKSLDGTTTSEKIAFPAKKTFDSAELTTAQFDPAVQLDQLAPACHFVSADLAG